MFVDPTDAFRFFFKKSKGKKGYVAALPKESVSRKIVSRKILLKSCSMSGKTQIKYECIYLLATS